MKKITFLIILFLMYSGVKAQVVFNEDFQTTTNLTAAGWTRYNDNYTPNGYQDIFFHSWEIVEWAVETPNLAASTTSQLIEGMPADRWLITPPIILSASAASATLNFKANSIDGFPQADGFLLKISTTNTNKLSFTTILNVTHAPTTLLSDTPGTVVDLTAYVGHTIYLAWVENTLNGNILNVDDITVSQAGLSNNVVAASTFSIAPNPTKDFIIITNDGIAQIDTIELLDVNGRIILTSNEETNQIDMSTFSQGVYYLKIKSQDSLEIKKIVKN